MIRATAYVLTVAVVLGVTLAIRYIRGGRWKLVGIVHGLVGATGLGLLLLMLQGPRHGDAMGAGSFGIVASVLFAIALAFGLIIPPAAARSVRAAGAVIATHASLAITAFVLFLAWISL